ncbi:hypothetical protein QBC35DRAFT_531708 [Podospora australis]|uniref:Uncharacterized protein n=1 Tax=Podospora australis TaxID=1536484 RepID=A0AAN7AK28_9PEZI|nr:hypothetical protein QBC35DRAFT_531708 [Podospora australis]
MPRDETDRQKDMCFLPCVGVVISNTTLGFYGSMPVAVSGSSIRGNAGNKGSGALTPEGFHVKQFDSEHMGNSSNCGRNVESRLAYTNMVVVDGNIVTPHECVIAVLGFLGQSQPSQANRDSPKPEPGSASEPVLPFADAARSSDTYGRIVQCGLKANARGKSGETGDRRLNYDAYKLGKHILTDNQ